MPETERRKAAEEMKARAQEHLVKYFHEIWDMDPPDEGIEHKEVITFMASFAAKEVERATLETSTRLKQIEEFLLGRDQRESPAESLEALILQATDSALLEAAGLVCRRCSDKSLAFPAKFLNGKWSHAYMDSTATVPCLAGPIHERLARSQKGTTP